jgi:dinuclear metal center YbgI/SA1388 family protein
MELELLINVINSVFPTETAMPEDKIGLQIQTESNIVNGILITLEVTEEVIIEAIEKKFNTILTFHPLIYSKLSNISLSERVGKLCSILIKNSINLISIHTTFDAFQFGTSRILSDKLDLIPIKFLVPDEKFPNCGMGIISKPKNELKPIELIERISEICAAPVRFTDNIYNKNLNKIAIVGGSGTSFIAEVLANNCDAFITADATYHQFHSVKNELLLIDVGHYEMEQFVPQGIKKALESFFEKNNLENNLRCETSKIRTNPICYFPNNENYSKKQKTFLN